MIESLKLQDPFQYKGPVSRDNVFHHVVEKGSDRQIVLAICGIISDNRGQSGLIYCLTRPDCETLFKDLKTYLQSTGDFDTSVSYYHAKLSPTLKSARHTAWKRGDIHVLCATSAFGMGIDKPDVRYVIHRIMPISPSQYVQHSGRGGRDGLLCNSYIFYRYQDMKRIMRLIERTGFTLTLEDQKSDLKYMVLYCENNSTCRRVELSTYFDEFMTYEYCNGTCDNWCVILSAIIIVH